MKLLRYIIPFIIPFCLYVDVYADLSAQLELSTDTVEVGERFEVNIRMTNSGTGGSYEIESIRLDALDNFLKISESQSTQIVLINGVSQAQTQLQYTFEALKEGEYDIGPATITLGDDTEIITQTQPLTVVSNINTPEGLFMSQGPESKFTLKSSFFVFFLGIVFLAVFYTLLLSYLGKEKMVKSVGGVQKTDISPKQEHILLKALSELEHRKNTLSRSDFYSEFNALLRQYLKLEGVHTALTMTGVDIIGLKQTVNPHVIQIFEETYLREFKDDEDTLEQRETYIQSFKKVLQK